MTSVVGDTRLGVRGSSLVPLFRGREGSAGAMASCREPQCDGMVALRHRRRTGNRHVSTHGGNDASNCTDLLKVVGLKR